MTALFLILLALGLTVAIGGVGANLVTLYQWVQRYRSK